MGAALRATALTLALALASVGMTGATTTAAADEVTATSSGLPSSVAVLGDSISQATGANGGGQGGWPGQSRPRNSWATGDYPGLNSNYQRIDGLAGGGVQPYNLSANGARVELHLVSQAQSIPPGTDYVLILMGGNDLCRPTVEDMTPTAVYDAEVATALSWIASNRPTTQIGVVSVPDIYRLWEIRRTNFWAVLFWASGIIPCQSLLADPLSTSSSAMARRAAVRARGLEYNDVLRARCDEHAQCLYDDDAVWIQTNDPATFVDSDISTQDHFHPSYAGQQKLASMTWNALYDWAAIASPLASAGAAAEPTTATADATATASRRAVPSRAAARELRADPPLTTEWQAGPAVRGLTTTAAHARAASAVDRQPAIAWQQRYLRALRQSIPATAEVPRAQLLDWPMTLCQVLDSESVTAAEVAGELEGYGVDGAVAGFMTGAATAALCPAHAG